MEINKKGLYGNDGLSWHKKRDKGKGKKERVGLMLWDGRGHSGWGGEVDGASVVQRQRIPRPGGAICCSEQCIAGTTIWAWVNNE